MRIVFLSKISTVGRHGEFYRKWYRRYLLSSVKRVRG